VHGQPEDNHQPKGTNVNTTCKSNGAWLLKYQQAKGVMGETFLLFRVGDFYELLFDDARVASRVLGLTLTFRDKSTDSPVPVAGFPHHQLDHYLVKLIASGYRCAICDQLGPEAAE